MPWDEALRKFSVKSRKGWWKDPLFRSKFRADTGFGASFALGEGADQLATAWASTALPALASTGFFWTISRQ